MMPKCAEIPFINKAKEIHGDRYDYSKVKYINAHTKVCIICPEHGEFWQKPNNHLNGFGCKKCGFKKRALNKTKNTKQFIEKAKKVHEEKFDYSKVDYVNSQTKVCIICPIHGEFWQVPSNHLFGKGCPKCNGRDKTTEQFIEEARQIHNDRFDYSNVKYVNSTSKVCIICKEHGEFYQTPSSHLSGRGCPKCGKTAKLFLEDFIVRSNQIHQNKYNYSKVEYANSHTKVCIICPTHGEFYQRPNDHLNGQGCPICNQSSLEKEVIHFLNKEHINYVYQVLNDDFEWLGRMSLDFYLPSYNIAIECQGIQHFKPVDFAGKGEEWAKHSFDKIQERDKRKKQLCLINGVKLYYINYNEDINNKLKEILNVKVY